MYTLEKDKHSHIYIITLITCILTNMFNMDIHAPLYIQYTFFSYIHKLLYSGAFSKTRYFTPDTHIYRYRLKANCFIHIYFTTPSHILHSFLSLKNSLTFVPLSLALLISLFLSIIYFLVSFKPLHITSVLYRCFSSFPLILSYSVNISLLLIPLFLFFSLSLLSYCHYVSISLCIFLFINCFNVFLAVHASTFICGAFLTDRLPMCVTVVLLYIYLFSMHPNMSI